MPEITTDKFSNVEEENRKQVKSKSNSGVSTRNNPRVYDYQMWMLSVLSRNE